MVSIEPLKFRPTESINKNHYQDSKTFFRDLSILKNENQTPDIFENKRNLFNSKMKMVSIEDQSGQNFSTEYKTFLEEKDKRERVADLLKMKSKEID